MQKREKRIEEIKKVLDGVCGVTPLGECYDVDCDFCKATHLYNAGYRKQSEGEWVKYPHGSGIYCSLCKHKRRYRDINDAYCPNCGAKMKGGAE